MQIPGHVYSRLENFRTTGSFGKGSVRQALPENAAADLDRTIGSTVIGLIQADEQDGLDLSLGKVGEVKLDAGSAQEFGLGDGDAGVTAHLIVSEQNDPVAEVESSDPGNSTLQRLGLTQNGHSAAAIFPSDDGGFVMQGWFVVGGTAWQESIQLK